MTELNLRVMVVVIATKTTDQTQIKRYHLLFRPTAVCAPEMHVRLTFESLDIDFGGLEGTWIKLYMKVIGITSRTHEQNNREIPYSRNVTLLLHYIRLENYLQWRRSYNTMYG